MRPRLGLIRAPGLMFRVRPFVPKDAPALDAIYRDCRAEANWLPSLAKKKSNFARDTKGEILLVAVGSNDEPVGFLSVWEPESFVHHLYVRQPSRRNGIGELLLRALNSRVPTPWKLKCLRANEAALAFYINRGWKRIGSGKGEEGPFFLLEKA